MWRPMLIMLGGLVACHHAPTQKAADAAADAFVFPDAGPPPPPSFDAGPPPREACTADAGTCMLPPSTCLDHNYLVYYTGGTCDAGTCRFTTNLLYCPESCMNGGCLGGFT